ncbi:MAG: hypothetical protein R2713_01390 [Ilumatobacteraceae bacterium]
MPAPVRPWSTSGWKNCESDPQVADMITSGSHEPFSTSPIAWVQNAPEVWISSTSASDAASDVNWLVRFGAVGSCSSSATTSRSVPSM